MSGFIKKILAVTSIIFICVFMISCIKTDELDKGSSNVNTPEPMSSKSALQYFRDEGIKIGINIGDTLDACDSWTDPKNPVAIETIWHNPLINQEYLNGLKNLGFDIVRIPVTWMGHIGPAPDYKVSETRLKRIADVVGYAKTAGLKAIINMHHDGYEGHKGWLFVKEAPGDPSITVKFEKVWEQIAEYFKNYGDYLMFQAFNELHDGSWKMTGTPLEYAIINDWNQRFTNAVRRTGSNNSTRYLLYYGYMTSYEIAGADYLKFKLPSDGSNSGRQIVGFHWYDPFDFVFNSSSHLWPNSSLRGNRDAINTVFMNFKTRFIDNGIPVIIGENGPARYVNHEGNTSYSTANAATARENRLLYIDYMYSKARENELIPFFWESGHSQDGEVPSLAGHFGLINRSNGQPRDAESDTVIKRMMAAVNNTVPLPQGGGITTTSSANADTAAIFSSWSAFNAPNSSITHTTPSGRQKIQGNVAEGGYANITANLNDSELTQMRTMKSFSFMVLGDGKQYRVMIPTTESNVAYNHYGFAFTAASTETRITVNVPVNLSQDNWGGHGVVNFFQNNIQSLQFSLSGTGTFDLTVWDIRIIQ
ncbi:MAG: glycoside hydrolase family 5 protein [Treponema sp.]|nr:glycoside hydrolase family 5 protein [Treponema sp.]